MKVALTGATGFLGRYLADNIVNKGTGLRAWYRPKSDRAGMSEKIEWVSGQLGSTDDCLNLIDGCDAVVHSALSHAGGGFRNREGDLIGFLKINLIGTIELIEQAYLKGIKKFIFISSCAVHDKILSDRPLDETHPLWMQSHYGAHKAAIEAFVQSYALGKGFNICSLRPTGIYGLSHIPEQSKWYDIIRSIAAGDDVEVSGGGKEVHASDVAKAVGILLKRDTFRGDVFNCYDMYISKYQVAQIAKEICNSSSKIMGQVSSPKNQIITEKIRSIGMQFGGESLLKGTISQILTSLK